MAEVTLETLDQNKHLLKIYFPVEHFFHRFGCCVYDLFKAEDFPSRYYFWEKKREVIDNHVVCSVVFTKINSEEFFLDVVKRILDNVSEEDIIYNYIKRKDKIGWDDIFCSKMMAYLFEENKLLRTRLEKTKLEGRRGLI